MRETADAWPRLHILLGTARYRCACLSPRLAGILGALLLPLWLALLPLAALGALLLRCGILRLPTHTEGSRGAPEEETSFPDQQWEGFPHRLDCGVYWFSARNGGARHQDDGEGDRPSGRARFDARRPSLLYVHGLAPTTVKRGFRETFNWGQQPGGLLPREFDVNTAQAWVAAGWNVGVFYWSQLSDEVDVRDAEAKIWTAHGPRAMRWLRKGTVAEGGLLAYEDDPRTAAGRQRQPAANLDATEAEGGAEGEVEQGQRQRQQQLLEAGCGTGAGAAPCVGAMLATELRRIFGVTSGGDGDSAQGSYRLIGHSLGAQLAVAAAHRLLREGGCPLPARVVLVDPYVSPGVQQHHGGRRGGEVLCEQIRALRDHGGGGGVAFEHVQTSAMDDVPLKLAVDLGAGLRPGGGLAAFVRLRAPAIPWWDLRGGHVGGPALYMLSLEMGQAGREAGVRQQQRRRQPIRGHFEWEWAPFHGLAAASDDAIRQLSALPYGFSQCGTDFLRVPKRRGGDAFADPEPPRPPNSPDVDAADVQVHVEVTADACS